MAGIKGKTQCCIFNFHVDYMWIICSVYRFVLETYVELERVSNFMVLFFWIIIAFLLMYRDFIKNMKCI